MKRFLTATMIAVGFAAVANAASLTITPDKTSYNVGESIVLTITGDSGGVAAQGVFGALALSGTGSMTYVSGSQSPISSFGGALPWTPSAVGAQNTVFNQIVGVTPFPGDWTSPLAVATYTAATLGVVNIGWNNDSSVGALNFFGIAVGDAGTASITIVPEPTTASLLALGLIGLAMRRRGST